MSSYAHRNKQSYKKFTVTFVTKVGLTFPMQHQIIPIVTKLHVKISTAIFCVG